MVGHAPIFESTAAGDLHGLERNGIFAETYMMDRTLAWYKISLLYQDQKS